MAVVVNFGSEISFVVFEKNMVAKNVRLSACEPEMLAGDELKPFVENLVELYPDILHEPVYLTFTSGSGVVYKTFSIGQESVMVNGTRTTNVDKQNAAKELIDSLKPFGLDGEYVSTVLTEYKTDTDYVLSCAYYPVSVLENIKKYFSEAGISVLDMHPMVYGVYKALNPQRFNQAIIDCGDELMLVNQLGSIVWSKPVDFNKDIANQYLITQSQISYGIDPDIAETIFIDSYSIGTYLLPGFSGEADVFTASAFGIAGKVVKTKSKKAAGTVGTDEESAQSVSAGNPMMSQNKKKGGLKDVIAQLRLLFDTKGKE